MGKVIMSGAVPTLTTPTVVSANFADNTWSQIIKACQTNKVPDTWAVSDQKTMTIGGTDYAIDIIGKNHDTYSTGGTAPLTFQMYNCYGTTYAMNSSNTNAGGWASCAMRTTHLPAILALMPSEVQAGIREVNKLTSAGSQSTTINTTADKLFLLSDVEVSAYSITSLAVRGEGTQYAYYQASGNKNKGINWWLRSPHKSNSTAFCCKNTLGSTTYSTSNTEVAVSFAFCF